MPAVEIGRTVEGGKGCAVMPYIPKKPNRNMALRVIDDAVCGMLRDLNARQLRRLVAACEALSQTNCSWTKYALGPGIKQIAGGMLPRRKVVR